MILPALIAAGAVVWRSSPAGDIEVALIHRPHYDDWSLPKGKPHAGETLPATAVREVAEETGHTVILGPRLGCTRYPVSAGEKVAHYWVARPTGGSFHPSDEVDELRWLPVPKALELLTHQHDRTLLAGLPAWTGVTTAVLLLRHAEAGERESWQRDDDLRPLTAEGRRQAESLRALLPLFGVRRVYSASPCRCRQTVEGVAADLGVPIVTEPWLSEKGYAAEPAAGRSGFLQIAAEPGGPAVVCSQGGVIPDLLRTLPGFTGLDLTDGPKKGSYWALFFASGSPAPLTLLAAADYYDDHAVGSA